MPSADSSCWASGDEPGSPSLKAPTYYPFGQLRGWAGGVTQPMQFSTKPYDEKTRLSYYGYRFYVPGLGRWLTRDPIGEEDGINLYEFVGNNPNNLIDPSGLYRWPSGIFDDAFEDAKSTYPADTQAYGKGAAYRHCLASCLMAKENGDLLAQLLGWANEKWGDWLNNQQGGKRDMDDFNNAFGRKLAKKCKDSKDCKEKCKNATDNNELKTYKPSSTPGYWDKRYSHEAF